MIEAKIIWIETKIMDQDHIEGNTIDLYVDPIGIKIEFKIEYTIGQRF